MNEKFLVFTPLADCLYPDNQLIFCSRSMSYSSLIIILLGEIEAPSIEEVIKTLGEPLKERGDNDHYVVELAQAEPCSDFVGTWRWSNSRYHLRLDFKCDHRPTLIITPRHRYIRRGLLSSYFHLKL